MPLPGDKGGQSTSNACGDFGSSCGQRPVRLRKARKLGPKRGTSNSCVNQPARTRMTSGPAISFAQHRNRRRSSSRAGADVSGRISYWEAGKLHAEFDHRSDVRRVVARVIGRREPPTRIRSAITVGIHLRDCWRAGYRASARSQFGALVKPGNGHDRFTVAAATSSLSE